MVLIATTTFTITRQADDGDPYEPAPLVAVATVSGHLSAPGGADINIGGQKELITAVAYLPTGTDVAAGDRIVDLEGGAYFVVWARPRTGLGLGHVVAGVRAVGGGADG